MLNFIGNTYKIDRNKTVEIKTKFIPKLKIIGEDFSLSYTRPYVEKINRAGKLGKIIDRLHSLGESPPPHPGGRPPAPDFTSIKFGDFSSLMFLIEDYLSERYKLRAGIEVIPGIDLTK